jgi:hypothetical protein
LSSTIKIRRCIKALSPLVAAVFAVSMAEGESKVRAMMHPCEKIIA